MPEISIIVPVYKVEAYLDRCVESILNQTFTDFELILVDDGSPDNCPKMCDEWAKKDARIRVIHKKNGGASSARNQGLEIAKGRYIGFVDSDDWILSNMYMILYCLSERTDCDISICGITRDFSKEKKSVKEKVIYTTYTQIDYLKKLLKINTQDSNHYIWNKLYKSEILKNISFPQLVNGEDLEFSFLAVLNAKNIVETNQVGYVYCVNPNSITTSCFNEKQLDYLIVCDRIVKIAEKRCDCVVKKYTHNFRARADFGILCKIAISDIKRGYNVSAVEDTLLKDFRRNYITLINERIPLNRKIIMTLMYINYPLTKRLLMYGSKVMRRQLSHKY
uniref:glycosyltransferase family 2 protein n=1 Tax=Agathobacter sp. TaxID=2021311 RepID=UPI004055A044